MEITVAYYNNDDSIITKRRFRTEEYKTNPVAKIFQNSVIDTVKLTNYDGSYVVYSVEN